MDEEAILADHHNRQHGSCGHDGSATGQFLSDSGPEMLCLRPGFYFLM